MLQRVAGETGRARDVEEPLAGIDATGEFNRWFEGRIEIGNRDVALVDVDLRNLAAQEDDACGLRARHAADQEDPAILLL